MNMTGFVQNMTAIVPDIAVVVLNITGLVLTMTGFVLNTIGSVLNMTGFDDGDDDELNGMAYITVWTNSCNQTIIIKEFGTDCFALFLTIFYPDLQVSKNISCSMFYE